MGILARSCLQCKRILGGRNIVRVRNIVLAAIFDFMTVEDWGEYRHISSSFAFGSILRAQRKRLHCRLSKV